VFSYVLRGSETPVQLAVALNFSSLSLSLLLLLLSFLKL
jgi:hypothetical protein